MTARVSLPDSQQALAKTLGKIFHTTGKGRKVTRAREHRHPAQEDIVSESLCDDVINYLAPTLEKHKGCTLIDVHPGVCLFSSKLHDFLKPKRHLLLEPEKRYFEPFIKPLLNKPGSTYRYSTLSFLESPLSWQKFRQIEQDPSLLPSKDALAVDDIRRKQLDSSYLVIGNIARRPVRKAGAARNLPSVRDIPFTLQKFAHHALTNDIFHNGGLVRVLCWVPDWFKPNVIPNTAFGIHGIHATLGMGLQVSEVAGVTSTTTARHTGMNYRKRSDMLDKTKNRAVRARMRDAGISVPKGREVFTVETSGELRGTDAAAVKSPLALHDNNASELEKRIDELAIRFEDVSMIMSGGPTKTASILEAALKTLEYSQALQLVRVNKQRAGVHVKRTAVATDFSLRLLNLEANFKSLEEQNILTGEASDTLRQKILDIDIKFHNLMDAAPLRTKVLVSDLTEDQILAFTDPPLLSWDQRAYEPLRAATSDFYPPFDLMLLDMMPKSTDLAVPGLADSREAVQAFVEMVRALYVTTSSPLPRALDKVGINAGKDLIPMVPAITDVRRGGRLNPSNLTVRMLTSEMLEGLVKAFFEWPFRPQAWQLALASTDEATTDQPDSDTGEKVEEAITG